MIDEATPRPWATHPDDLGSSYTRAYQSIDTGEQGIAGVWSHDSCGKPLPMAANAALIVEAVNNYDCLLAANKAMASILGEWLAWWGTPHRLTAGGLVLEEKTRAALRLADAKEGL